MATKNEYGYTVEDYTSALLAIPTPGDEPTWVLFAKAAKAAGIDYACFDSWAQKGENYDPLKNRQRWDGFDDGKLTNPGFLINQAKANGWAKQESFHGCFPTGAISNQGLPRPEEQRNNDKELEKRKKEAMAYIREAAKHREGALEYLARRGISHETAERFNLGFNPASPNFSPATSALVIPYPEEKYYAERCTTFPPNAKKVAGKRFYNPSGLPIPVFNAPALRKGDKTVFITEGQIDAITIEQAGRSAIAVKEASKLNDELKNGDITVRRFCIVQDNDETGEVYAKGLEVFLKKEYAVIRMLVDDAHDPNELLVKKGQEALEEWLSKVEAKLDEVEYSGHLEYNGNSFSGSRDTFLRALECGETVIPTGFNGLDKALGSGGIPIGSFVVIGAQSSMGKTTLCLQLADQMAAQGRDVLYIALEQGKTELMAKSVSRILYQHYLRQEDGEVILRDASRRVQAHCLPVELSAMDIRTGFKDLPDGSPVKSAIYKVILDYAASDAGKSLYFKECRGEDISPAQIREAVENHKSKTGNVPIVIVDYLQLLASETSNGTGGKEVPKARDERDILNNNIKSLTAIGRDLHTVVIAISAFNRSNKDAANTDSFFGTSRIEYSADILMALEPDISTVKDDEDVMEGFSAPSGKRGNTSQKTRPGTFNIDKWKEKYSKAIDGIGGVMRMLLKILKNRDGRPCASVQLDFKPKCNAFKEHLND